MKNIIVSLALLTASSLFANQAPAVKEQKLPSSLDSYFQYLDKYPKTLGPSGNAALGEIEIIKDRTKIAEIEQTTGRQVGVVAADRYWLWLNDAVKFPNGKFGVYGRLIWQQSLQGPAGVAVMAVLPDGKIALNRNYRHATRSWEYELPRGGLNPGETIEAAALREVKEETGMIIDQLHLLGQMAIDTGLTNSIAPIFMAKVIQKQEAEKEDSEAIASIDAFTVEELKKGYIDGYLSTTVDGKVCKINLRDPFLAYALFQAEIRELIQPAKK